MCEVYGFCGSAPIRLNKYTNTFWTHATIHKDGFGYYLADKNELYVDPSSAYSHLNSLSKKDFTSSLALCHIRFKTHGPAKLENCHPFTKYDSRDHKWTLIHNGYIKDNVITSALGTLQIGETDSERILMYIVESINSFYEHEWISDIDEFLYYMYIQIESTLQEVSTLGKANLIFTDSFTNNMYIYSNSHRNLYYLKSDSGVHISTTPLSDEDWQPVEPFKLHIFNNGDKLDF